MLFDISSLRMHDESFEHEQNIQEEHTSGSGYLEYVQNEV